MRKSSLNRLSVSGAPLRVINENQDARGGRTSSKERSSSFGGRKFGGVGHGSQSQKTSYNNSRPSTSGNRFSIGVKAKSSASSSRASGIGVRGRTDIPKDPRPISDKRYVHKLIKRLIEFLVANNYPHATSEKLLAAPSSKDFFKIFEFVYGHLSPGYKMGAKMEEEVPKLLKMIGYPFTISKMHLFSVGSPHVWPNMCAALIWLIDLIQVADSITHDVGIDAIIFHCDDSVDVPEEKLLFDYTEKTYKAFMEGSDSYEDHNAELETLLKLKCQGGNIEDIMDENEKLEQNLQILGQKEERLLKLQEKINKERQDLLKFQNYTDKLGHYKRSLATKIKTLDDDLALLQTELQNDKQQLEKVQEIYENQEFTPADVERMKEEREQLKRQIKQLEQQEESIDEEIFKTNIDTAKISEKAAAEVSAYNRLAADLKLIPSSAENANDEDYSLISKHNANIPQTFDQVIKPKLIQMKKQCTEDMRRMNKQKYLQTYQLEQLQEKVNETRDDVKEKNIELTRLEAEVESLKQLTLKENRSKSSEKNRLVEMRSEYESQIKVAEELKDTAETECRAAQKELETKKTERDRKIQELEKEKVKVKQEFDNHKETLRIQLSKYVEYLRKVDKQMDDRVEKASEESERLAKWMEEKKEQLSKLTKTD